MITLNTSVLRISEIAKVLSKYPIKSNVSHNEIILDGYVPPECFNELAKELLGLGIKISSISNTQIVQHNPKLPMTKQQTSHATRITQSTNQYNVIYNSPKYGEVYWVDFGSPFGYEEAFMRPALVVKSSGVFKSITTVIPLSSKVERYTDSVFTPIFEFSANNMVDFDMSSISAGNIKSSCLLVEQMRAIDKSRLRGYIGTMNEDFMYCLMQKIRNIFEDDNNLKEISVV